MDPIARTCRTNHPAYHHSGERRATAIRYIVLHATESPDDDHGLPSAEYVAEYFMLPSSSGSANLVVDDGTCYRCLPDTVIPWGAPPLNTNGFHIEQCGYSSWTRKQWMKHEVTIERAAFKASLRVKQHRIPVRFLTVDQLREDFGELPAGNAGGVPVHPGPLHGGLLTHATVSAAYHQSDHTDPGDGYPQDVFLSHLEKYLAQEGYRP